MRIFPTRSNLASCRLISCNGDFACSIFRGVYVNIFIASHTAAVNPGLRRAHGKRCRHDRNELIKTGSLVSFRIVEEEVLAAPDEAEFGMRLLLRFVAEEGEDDQDEDDVAEDTAEWGAFGFMFVLGVLSFAEARPRNMSSADYHEKDEFTVADFIEGLRFVRGELHFDADYIRGRRIKTRIAVRANGTVKLETIGRGKAVLRWLDRLQGKKLLQSVGE